VECLPSGCTDSVATNYEPTSTVDDGSCEYTYERLTGDVVVSQSNCESSGDCTYVPFVPEQCEVADTETCPRTDLSSENEDVSRTACLDAGCVRYSGYGFCIRSNCNYITRITHEPMVEVACAATRVVSCDEADINSDDPTVSESNILPRRWGLYLRATCRRSDREM
jgi:hypothetical protein